MRKNDLQGRDLDFKVLYFTTFILRHDRNQIPTTFFYYDYMFLFIYFLYLFILFLAKIQKAKDFFKVFSEYQEFIRNLLK